MSDATLVSANFTVEFAGPAWFDFYQMACIAACRLGVMGDGVTCEVYRDVPAHLAADGTIAWTRRVSGGSCSFEFVECADEEATSKIRADYAALLPLARFMIGEDDSAFTAIVMKAIEDGKMEIVRHDPQAPNDHLVHNLAAALTR